MSNHPRYECSLCRRRFFKSMMVVDFGPLGTICRRCRRALRAHARMDAEASIAAARDA